MPYLFLEEKAEECLRSNLSSYRRALEEALDASHRSFESVKTIIVTKNQPTNLLPLLWNHGYSDIGESRVQGMVKKQAEIRDYFPHFSWHLIGSLQKNKIKKALISSTSLQSIDSLIQASEVSRHMKLLNRSCDVFLQVNPLKEDSKQGFLLEELMKKETIEELHTLLGRNIRGVMALAPDRRIYGDEVVHSAFSTTERLYHTILNMGILDTVSFDSLSMGMSQDFDIALLYGSTHIRIGTKIFQGVCDNLIEKV